MVEKLMDFMRRGNVDTVDKLVYSLRKTDQSHVASCLREPGKPDNRGDGEFAEQLVVELQL